VNQRSRRGVQALPAIDLSAHAESAVGFIATSRLRSDPRCSPRHGSTCTKTADRGTKPVQPVDSSPQATRSGRFTTLR
jgi:hypothetical protein